MERGSIEKGNEPAHVIGLKKRKIDGSKMGQVMCKVAWKPFAVANSECASQHQILQIDSTGGAVDSVVQP